jgi:hypothetical protein
VRREPVGFTGADGDCRKGERLDHEPFHTPIHGGVGN